MKNIALISAAATIFLSICCCKGPIPGFNPDDATVLTDLSKDKMTHCSIFTTIGDEYYLAYYLDTVQVEENPEIPSITAMLARAKWPLDGNFKRIVAMRAGMTCGSFTQDSTRAPYDPNLLKIGDKLMYYFNGCVDGTVVYCVRPFDLGTDSFENQAYQCTLSFGGEKVPMNSRNLFALMQKLGYDASFENDVVMSHRFIKHDGAYYNVMANAFSNASKPLVFKTVNGFDFEFVMACGQNPGGACEAAFEIMDDELYLLTRDHFSGEIGNGMYISKYSLTDGSCLAGPFKLTEQTSKGAMICRGKTLYAIYNALPDIEKNGVPVGRSRLRIARIDKDCSVADSLDIIGQYGIHYPYTDYVGDDIYMTFTEDRREISPVGWTRSNLSMSKLDL